MVKQFGSVETIAFLDRVTADYALFEQEQLLAIVEAKKVSIGTQNV